MANVERLATIDLRQPQDIEQSMKAMWKKKASFTRKLIKNGVPKESIRFRAGQDGDPLTRCYSIEYGDPVEAQ